MKSIYMFLVGMSIPIIIVIIFWNEFRPRRERTIKFIKNLFKRRKDD